jgi:hypothetical protein
MSCQSTTSACAAATARCMRRTKRIKHGSPRWSCRIIDERSVCGVLARRRWYSTPAGKPNCRASESAEHRDSESDRFHHGVLLLEVSTPSCSRSSSGSRRMCLPRNGCTATTPRCRFWPKARLIPVVVGFTRVMIGHLPDRRRPLRYFTTRVIAAVNIRNAIWRGGLAFCRPMPMAGTKRCMLPAEAPGRSVRLSAGLMAGGSCSSWRILPRRRAEKRAARPPSYRRSRWRR